MRSQTDDWEGMDRDEGGFESSLENNIMNKSALILYILDINISYVYLLKHIIICIIIKDSFICFILFALRIVRKDSLDDVLSRELKIRVYVFFLKLSNKTMIYDYCSKKSHWECYLKYNPMQVNINTLKDSALKA